MVRADGPPEPTVYFAYGSNMLTERLRVRMSSCVPIGTATLPGHVLRFHKRSKDGSGKCNALATEDGDVVVGVLFSFDLAERERLDKAEGVGNGYNHAMVTVINAEGRRRKVLTYLADSDHIDDRLQPYTWYKELVLAGAGEHDLPASYVAARIAPVEAISDPNAARDAKERSVICRMAD
jgi:cation transport regulator ChaC